MEDGWKGEEIKYLPLVNIIGIPWLVLLVGGRHVEFCGGGGGVRASKKVVSKKSRNRPDAQKKRWVPYRTLCYVTPVMLC
jgi:hypothetical protein